MATPKQEKLISLLLENLGTGKNTKTLGEMLLEAGYSKSQAKNPFQILETKAVKEGLSGVVTDLEQLRENALKELKTRNLKKEAMRDVVKAVDIYTKNHQLLTGGDTERSTTKVTGFNMIRNETNNNTN